MSTVAEDDKLAEIRLLTRSRDVQGSLRKLKRIARLGDREVQFALGIWLLWDMNAVRSGLYWIRCAANHDLVGAQYLLGSGYATGFDFKKDLSKAVYWYRRAAKLGHAEAQYNLALMYFDGEGVPKSLSRGRKWLERAGTSGDLLALELLWNASRNGLFGFRVSKSASARWARKLASARGQRVRSTSSGSN